MATQYISQNGKTTKKTEFVRELKSDMRCIITHDTPAMFAYVEHLGFNVEYGDLFLAWQENRNEAILYIGAKGEEFNQ